MRVLITYLIVFFLFTQSYGQLDTTYFFNEFSFSVNQTNVKDYKTANRVGFGLGAHRCFRTDKRVSITFGFEINRTKQFKKYIYEGRFATVTDATYTINSFSIPITARINFGNKKIMFIEPGLFIDVNTTSRIKGTMYSGLPTQNSHTVTAYDGGSDITNINFGPSAGLGVKIPIKRKAIIIRLDYKLGLRKLYTTYDQVFNNYFRLILAYKI